MKEDLLEKQNDIQIVGNCPNCGVEYHIHQNKNQITRETAKQFFIDYHKWPEEFESEVPEDIINLMIDFYNTINH